MHTARVRTAAYVIRGRPGGRELLVFDHRDFPEAGTQVPAGGVEGGELLAEAALREIAEETGVAGVTLGTALAVQQSPHPHTGQPQITVYFQAETAETRDGWMHTVVSGDEDRGMAFRCFFVPLEQARGLLAGDQGEFVGLVR
ncbi:NUDIX domain-containing protein [Streptomyces sp. NPDC004134]|uniref:NUDIX hydrolase n=1 Tax=Streptomyces sp. NPDC004134 TaxID=3364691 RepID=UPI0036CF6F1B